MGYPPGAPGSRRTAWIALAAGEAFQNRNARSAPTRPCLVARLTMGVPARTEGPKPNRVHPCLAARRGPWGNLRGRLPLKTGRKRIRRCPWQPGKLCVVVCAMPGNPFMPGRPHSQIEHHELPITRFVLPLCLLPHPFNLLVNGTANLGRQVPVLEQPEPHARDNVADCELLLLARWRKSVLERPLALHGRPHARQLISLGALPRNRRARTPPRLPWGIVALAARQGPQLLYGCTAGSVPP